MGANHRTGRIVVWYGPTWSLEEYIQFVGFLPRTGRGQKYGVIVHHLIRSWDSRYGVPALTVKNQTQSGFGVIKQALYE